MDEADRQNIGISIVDHNELRGSIAGYSLGKIRNIPFLCGIEIGTQEGKELLLYFENPDNLERFYKNEIEKFKTARMTRIERPMKDFLHSDMRDKYDIGLVTLPHPFGLLFKSINWKSSTIKKK